MNLHYPVVEAFRCATAAAGIAFHFIKLPMLHMASYQVDKVLSMFLCCLVEPGLGRGATDTPRQKASQDMVL